MKLIGFYRIFRTYPAPVIPLFSNGDKLFSQKIVDRSVVDFVELNDISENRIAIKNDPNFSEIVIGDPAIYAIEYKENGIRFANYHTFCGYVGDLISENTFDKSSFSLLEFSHFINSEEWARVAAIRCANTLKAKSHRLFSQWLEGSELARKFLPEGEKVITVDGEKYIHISFTSSFFILRTLSVFSNIKLNTNRSDVVREIFRDICNGDLERFTMKSIEKAMHLFLGKVDAGNNLEKRILCYDEARGNVNVKMSEYNLIKEYLRLLARDIKRRFSGNSVAFKHVTSSLTGTQSKLLVFLIFCQFNVRFVDFDEFFMRRNVEEIYRNEYPNLDKMFFPNWKFGDTRLEPELGI